MGCSDVSEFENIYGQILTTPFCVYGRLFTWTRIVDFNALIVWKTFIYICFRLSQVFGHWQLPIRNSEEWFGRWYDMAVATGHVPRCVLLPRRNAGRLHLKKLKAYNFMINGWVKPLYRCWSAILVTTAMTQPPSLLSPIFLPTSAPPPF